MCHFVFQNITIKPIANTILFKKWEISKTHSLLHANLLKKELEREINKCFNKRSRRESSNMD